MGVFDKLEELLTGKNIFGESNITANFRATFQDLRKNKAGEIEIDLSSSLQKILQDAGLGETEAKAISKQLKVGQTTLIYAKKLAERIKTFGINPVSEQALFVRTFNEVIKSIDENDLDPDDKMDELLRPILQNHAHDFWKELQYLNEIRLLYAAREEAERVGDANTSTAINNLLKNSLRVNLGEEKDVFLTLKDLVEMYGTKQYKEKLLKLKGESLAKVSQAAKPGFKRHIKKS